MHPYNHNITTIHPSPSHRFIISFTVQPFILLPHNLIQTIATIYPSHSYNHPFLSSQPFNIHHSPLQPFILHPHHHPLFSHFQPEITLEGIHPSLSLISITHHNVHPSFLYPDNHPSFTLTNNQKSRATIPLSDDKAIDSFLGELFSQHVATKKLMNL